MIESLPTPAQLLKGQQELPEHLRDFCILLHFREVVPEWRVSEFYRIRLSQQMLQGGEEQHFLADVYQPDVMGQMKICSICKQPATQLDATIRRCENRKCVAYRRTVIGGPKSGVVQVKTFPDWVVADEEIEYEDGSVVTHPLVDRCLLILDRRYSQNVLSQIKRCAFNLAEMSLMPLKD